MAIKSPFSFFRSKSLVERPVMLTDGSDKFYTYMPNWGTYRDCRSLFGQAWAYNNCPAVNAVINKKVSALTKARWSIMNEKKDIVSGKNLGVLPALIKKPNPLQTWGEFVAQAKIYEQVFGEVFIIPVMPEWSTDPVSIAALWVVPNWSIKENITGKLFAQTLSEKIIESYTVTFNNEPFVVKPEKMLRIRDIGSNVTDDIEKILHGQSRLYPLTNPVSNIVAAYEARNTMIVRKGALGILSNDSKDVGGTIPIRPADKEQLQKDFQRYGLTKEQYQVIVTNASLRWQTMTFPTKELMLFEEIEDDTRQIADAYDIPMHLFGFKKGTTYANMNEAKKSFYDDTIIPEAENLANAIATFCGLPEELSLVPDYRHLEVFQKSQKDNAEIKRILCEAYKIPFEKKVVTMEEWRSALDLDPDNFYGNTFYVPPVTNYIETPQDLSQNDN